MSEITIYTLAKELNMTPSMVSRAFNPSARVSEEKRKIVLEAARKYNFSPNKFASRLSMKSVNIGVVLNSKFQINTDKMIAGIRAAYAELKDYKILYDVTVLRDCTEEELRQTLARYKNCDGVVLTGVSAARYTDLVNEFYEENPNIVQVQAINHAAKHLFASKHCEKTASYLAAEFLSNCLKRSKRKNVLLFTGDRQSALHAAAADAFGDACKEMGLELLAALDMKDSEDELARLVPAVFGQYGESLDGVYITSGFSLSLCRFLEQNGLDIPVVVFDTYDDIKRYIEKGIVSAAISQNVTEQMKTAFELLVKHLITGAECPKTVFTDVQLALKSNIHQFD